MTKLTLKQINRIDEICKNPPKITEYLLKEINRRKGNHLND